MIRYEEIEQLNISDRIARLRAECRDYVCRDEIPELDNAYRSAERDYAEESVIIQRAKGFSRLLDSKRIFIMPGDCIAGYIYQYANNVNLPMYVNTDFDPAARARFKMDVRRECSEAISLYGLNGSHEALELEEFVADVETWMLKHWHSGHTLAGYPRLLEIGFGGLLELTKNTECESEKERDSIEAFRIVISACMSYIERYAVLADEMGEQHMAGVLRSIEQGPATSFEEAVQLLWLAHEMMYCENVASAVSLGRFDQYMYPYYKKDIEAGKLTLVEAAELIESLYIKLSLNRKAYQNMTLGGCDRNGKLEINELTILCLRITGLMGLDQPSVNFRWPEEMPDKAWAAVLDLIRKGMGFPALMNDRCCIESRKLSGISKADANDYAIIGCVEFGTQGKEHAMTEMARINLPKLFSRMLGECRGKTADFGSDRQNSNCSCAGECRGKTADFGSDRQGTTSNCSCAGECRGKMDDFACVMDCFKTYLREYILKTQRVVTILERLYQDRYPMPYLSVLTESCIESARDIMAGGAKYNTIGLNLGGLGTLADSLAAIKKLVYDDAVVTLDEYMDAMERNFEGYETLRSLAARCPKYGNDNDSVDAIAVEILAVADETIHSLKTLHGGSYRMGLYTVEDHAIMGQETGATADGRLAGVSLSNSYCASQGRDRQGPTAVINTALKYDASHADNGLVLDLKFTPQLLSDASGQNALRSLINTYFKGGGMEIQFNVVSRETLLDAQRNPDEYANLIVRVSGFSAYFVSLRKSTQDEIIMRTEQ